MNLYGFSKEEILAQIRDEYDYGFNHIEAKRERRRKDIKLYVKESEGDNVNVHSIYTTIQTLLAINYMNEIAVEFTKRKNGDEEKAKNTNIIAKYDYNQMNLAVLDYIWEFNRLTTGVGIQISGGFDFVSMNPKIQNVDTLSYIFDPKGGPTIEDHRFFGIETEMTREEMRNAGYTNIEDVRETSNTVEQNSVVIDSARGQSFISDETKNKKFSVYICGTILKGEKYICATTNNNGTILDFKKLLPVFLDEEKDPRKIPFPIVFKYFSYMPGDSMGISPFDLLRGKQNAYSILFNLMLKMAYKNAMGGDRLINTAKIKDLTGLAVPSLDGQDIPVTINPGESIQDAIFYTQKDTPTEVPSQLRQWLSEESILDTGIDRNTQGVLSQGNNTLGEREMAQKNANLRFLLGSKQASWGDNARWKILWYRQYGANLKSIDKKEFALETGYSQDFHSFKKDDFFSFEGLHIKIENKAQIEQEREKLKLDRLARYPQEIQEAMNAGKKWKITVIQRNRMRDIGESEERIMKLYGYTSDELNAMDKFGLLKFAIDNEKNKKLGLQVKETKDLGLQVDSLEDEHEVFIEFFQTLPDSLIKKEAIKRRYDAIKYYNQLNGGVVQDTQGLGNSAGNTAISQTMSNQLNKGGEVSAGING